MSVSALFKIRLMQFFRLLQELGLIRVIIGVVALFIAFGAFREFVSAGENLLVIPAVLVISLLLLHQKRSDRQFFKLYAEKAQILHLLEYGFLAIPLSMMLGFHGHLVEAGITLIAPLAIPFIPVLKGGLVFNSSLQKFIPDELIEWKAGVRKMLLPIALLWLIGLSTSFFIGSVPIVIFLLGMLVSGFYERMESLTILVASERSAAKFLQRKIWLSVASFTVLNLPLVLAFAIFHPDQFYIPIVELILFNLLIAYAVVVKYRFYLPEPDVKGNQMLLAIGFIGVLIPFVLPVFLFFLLRFYFKARQNLNLYLHDFD